MINQSQSSLPRFVVGLVVPLLLPTLTIWFSLDHKLYASDYDSDSVTSKNQPLVNKEGSHAQYEHKETHFQRPKNRPALAGKCTRALKGRQLLGTYTRYFVTGDTRILYLLLQTMVQTRRDSRPLNISYQNKTFGKKFQPQHPQWKQNPQTQGSQSCTPPYYKKRMLRKVMRDPARRYLRKERQLKSDQPAKEPGLNNGTQHQQNQLIKWQQVRVGRSFLTLSVVCLLFNRQRSAELCCSKFVKSNSLLQVFMSLIPKKPLFHAFSKSSIINYLYAIRSPRKQQRPFPPFFLFLFRDSEMDRLFSS